MATRTDRLLAHPLTKILPSAPNLSAIEPVPPAHQHGQPYPALVAMYLALAQRWGPQNWWPARSRFEVIAGAVLTQNTNWSNAEKAILQLRKTGSLTPQAIRELPLENLQELIRCSGCYRQKAARLKAFVAFCDQRYAGSLTRMFAQPTGDLRRELLKVNGIGPETADSILLYAGNHPVFVVDAYARRILERHGIAPSSVSYEDVRALVEEQISQAPVECFEPSSPAHPRHPQSRISGMPRSRIAQLYNELHALIVRTGVEFCRSSPACKGCPLEPLLTPKQQARIRTNRIR